MTTTVAAVDKAAQSTSNAKREPASVAPQLATAPSHAVAVVVPPSVQTSSLMTRTAEPAVQCVIPLNSASRAAASAKPQVAPSKSAKTDQNLLPKLSRFVTIWTTIPIIVAPAAMPVALGSNAPMGSACVAVQRAAARVKPAAATPQAASINKTRSATAAAHNAQPANIVAILNSQASLLRLAPM